MLIKRTANKLVRDHKGSFTNDFNDNKTIVTQFADIPSKKLKNVIAGYVTRLTKRQEE